MEGWEINQCLPIIDNYRKVIKGLERVGFLNKGSWTIFVQRAVDRESKTPTIVQAMWDRTQQGHWRQLCRPWQGMMGIMPPRWNNGSSTWHILHICFCRTIHNAFTVPCLINFHFISWSQIFLSSHPCYCPYKNKHRLQTIFLSKEMMWLRYESTIWKQIQVYSKWFSGFQQLATSFSKCNLMWFLSMGLRQGSGLCSSSSREYPGTEGTNQNRHWNHHRWHALNSLEWTRLSC